MNLGLAALLVLLGVLLFLAVRQRQDFGPMVQRMLEQFAVLVPRMLCALIAAGFIAQLIPKETIAGFLGDDAGLMAIPIAALTGLIVPAGPVIAFAIAAIFAKAGASTAALITFISSWSIFATHRILIYEIPLLGVSFLRLRVLAAMAVPILAGLIAYGLGYLSSYGEAVPVQ